MAPHNNSRSADKPKNTKLAAKRLFKDLSSHYVIIAIVIIFCIISAITFIMTPMMLKDFINDTTASVMKNAFLEQENLTKFTIQICTMLGLYLASAISGWLANILIIRVSGELAYSMRARVKDKIDRLPLSYFDRVAYGETLSRATNDVDNISRNIQQIIIQVFTSVTVFIGAVIAMFITRWELALIAISVLPFIMLIVFLVATRSQKMFLSYRKELGILNGKVEENYAGYKIIKLFNKEKDIIDDFTETNVTMAKADNMSQFLSSLIFPTTNFINNLAFVFIAVVGGLLRDAGSMNAFFLYLNAFTRPFQQIGQIINVIQSVFASAERVYELLDEKEEIQDAPDAISDEAVIHGEYEFKDVSFSYTLDKPLIENMNLHISTGDTIAIVGPTGAGKTTIVNLLMRFYEINSGSILLDGVDIRDYKRDTLRDAVGMVLQDTWLFNGTIKENIKYGAPEATDEEVTKACKEAHALHFIHTLPGGFDFMLNEDGSNISQGQKQLLTIARAILSKPKILILDEATSSVDTRTEKAIQDALDNIMKGKTSFVIAHRLSTIKNAKVILVMKKGNIIENGTHDELIKKNGFYAELYNSQFLGTNLENEPLVES
ncbi:MAG: ABC transporter ATP-binding protein [Bacilli bacterium]